MSISSSSARLGSKEDTDATSSTSAEMRAARSCWSPKAMTAVGEGSIEAPVADSRG